ncbi:alpha-1,2-mannosyltransferase ALG9-like [Anneissia japonica]|uniref:alpha-1,2-mannosyltransferase ALG9-like n=1 Tax=Anneissia japonica TaxID=1529436 RepID=UPI0014258BC1|nr:alpha-1,2-mannosyltransferase ALG9-like [Anneissia japonica]XP_033124849.1 alpha-1,2-mannosyltransferase ALG9-like [Anneissia japonica]XP_033124855.1 alpha-1,2-mannosyltransferase ALG9-like [Anneissia japonica]
MSEKTIKSRKAPTATKKFTQNPQKVVVSENSASQNVQCWAPEPSTAIKLLWSARFCAALLSNITDCDETFNYWEPLHYVLFGKGFQTWEYSPIYAIRSYAYILLHSIPGHLHALLLQANKVLVFYFMRCVLGMMCALCEVYFYRGVCKAFGANIGRFTLLFLLISTGMFISSTAFIPSSFSMYMTMLSIGGWYLGNMPVAILATALSTFISWPFAGAIGIPIAVDILFRRKEVFDFVKWCIIAVCVILVPQVMIDSYYYGKLVIAPLNIVLYNVFSEHGPDIYGVEPWSFYFLNGALNFNIAFPMALVGLPITIAVFSFLNSKMDMTRQSIPPWLSLVSMYIWILIFFTRPHKEERFLFPIYPLFCLNAACTVASIQKTYHWLFSKFEPQHYTVSSNWFAASIAIVFSVLSLSRSAALFYGYHAPLDVYPTLHKTADNPKVHTLHANRQVNVCIGKEWYRFPSNFFMPENWELQFIQSDFKGQLPKPYSSRHDATQMIPTHMNDMNLEEPSRYVELTKCHYLIDLDLPKSTPLEPRFSELSDQWEAIDSQPFLDQERSDRIFRAFYIPFVSYRHVSYGNYTVFKTTRRKALPKRKPAV